MKRKHPAIGIDIGDHTVKCVQLETHNGALRVNDFDCIEIASGSTERADRRQSVAEAVRRVLRDGEFRGRACISSLRLFETTSRHLRISASSTESPADILRRELREGDQEEGDEFNFQFLPVAELLDLGERKREYMCCIADPLIVREHLAILSDAGLQPEAIDLDTCAQIRPFVNSDQQGDDLVLSVDLGVRCAHVVISRGVHPILMRTVPVGVTEIFRSLEQQLGIDEATVRDLAEASQLGGADDMLELTSAISRTVSGHYDAIIGRVLECARYAATLFAGKSLTRIRFLGEAAALPGAAEYLAGNLELEIESSNPFEALGLELPRATGATVPAKYATAVGLAMRGVPA